MKRKKGRLRACSRSSIRRLFRFGPFAVLSRPRFLRRSIPIGRGGPSHTPTPYAFHVLWVSYSLVPSLPLILAHLLLVLSKSKSRRRCAHLCDTRRWVRLSCRLEGGGICLGIGQGHDTGLSGGERICCPSKEVHGPQAGELLGDEPVCVCRGTKAAFSISLEQGRHGDLCTIYKKKKTHVSVRRRARWTRLRSL